MASEQSMTEAIMQAAIKAIKVVIKTVREAEAPVDNARQSNFEKRQHSTRKYQVFTMHYVILKQKSEHFHDQ